VDDTHIREIDPFDETDLGRWHATYLAAETHERPFASPWMLAEVRAQVQAPPVAAALHSLVLEQDGAVVATGGLQLPLKDNTHRASVLVHTHPDHRRHGHGTRMLRRLEELAAGAGRAVVTAIVDYPYDLGPEGAGDPGVELFRGAGYALALGDVQRTLDLPVADDLLESLATEAAPHHAGYRILDFVDRCPDELVASYGRLVGMLLTEAPAGELVVEDEVFDEERIRHDEEVRRASGRAGYVTVAVDADGEVVGMTEVAVPRHHPGRAYQQGTLVHPAHRGHRLGLALKVANHRLLQRSEPGLTHVVTYNAEVNAPMIGVNERLGFRPTARSAELQRTLG
jgi:RimJ/RimL family protein N-acetyltransferase